jgi:hypothetical protein
LVAAADVESARAQETPAPPPIKISTPADIRVGHPEFNPAISEVDSNSPTSVLGAAFDVVEMFLRLTEAEMLRSPMLTERSRDLLPNSPERQKLARIVELRAANWYDQFLDARFAGDRLATLVYMFRPRDPAQRRQIFTIDMVRKHDQWQVTLDLASDAASPLGDQADAHLAALHKAIDARLAEINGVISAPLDKPLPFHGTWMTHFRQSDVYVTFDTTGEVFFIRTEAGSAGYGVYDYHLTGDEVVIEAPVGPIRLHRAAESDKPLDVECNQVLILDEARLWFPECNEPIHVVPIQHDDAPIRRPTAATPAAEPAAK